MTTHQDSKIRQALGRMSAPVQDDRLLRLWIKGNPSLARKAALSMSYIGARVWSRFLDQLGLKEVQSVTDITSK